MGLLEEIVIVPTTLMVVFIIASSLSSSNSPGFKEASEYEKYLVGAVGAIWLASLPFRFRRSQ